MKFILLLLTFVFCLCDAAKRARTTTTSSTESIVEGRQMGFLGQPKDLENIWDQLEIQKLDNHAESWKKNPISRTNATEVVDSNGSSSRQFYPGLSPNPGDTNELPSPILPTIAPIPGPAPGCYALRGQFPSPKNCGNYLNCWDDVVIEQSCPDGLLFNDISLVCDFDYNVNCGSRPLPGPKAPLPPGSKYCPDLNGRYRSSTNCSEFYVCDGRRPVKFSCPRGLVYNDVLNVCDYLYNVDCKGAAVPKPPPSTNPPQQPTLPPQEPTYPQQPSYPPQQPSYPPQQPSYPPQQPFYPPQQPAYPANPWLGKSDANSWQQEATTPELETDKLQETEETEEQPVSEQYDNPWNSVQAIPAGLSKVPCDNGLVHRLNDACTNVVVCRNHRPQLVQCPLGYTFDTPTDSCKPFSIAKC